MNVGFGPHLKFKENKMGLKSDIQATRSAAAAGAGTAVIAGPIRLRAISVSSDGVGAGLLELTTTSNFRNNFT
jgi:hypothetical protein